MGPEVRRRFLDLALFHVEHRYLAVFSQLQKALRQRNAALKQGVAEQVRVWDAALVDAGIELTSMRQRIMRDLFERVTILLADWDLEMNLGYRYRQGWRKQLSLSEALQSRLMEDMEKGFTGVGPQRADVEFLSENALAEKRLSRGQQKMLVIALTLAVSDQIGLTSGGIKKPLLLVDDLGAELDHRNVQNVLKALSDRGLQAFVAMIDEPSAVQLAENPSKVFHVEHGKIK
jgi:DNA replication and repair protein RecF